MQGYNSRQFWHFFKEHAKARSVLYIVYCLSRTSLKEIWWGFEVKWTVTGNLTAVEGTKKGNDCMKGKIYWPSFHHSDWFSFETNHDLIGRASLCGIKGRHTHQAIRNRISVGFNHFSLTVNWMGISIVTMFSFLLTSFLNKTQGYWY